MCQSHAPPRRLQLADVFESIAPQLDALPLSGAQRQAVAAIRRCRTAAQGGRIWACDVCGHQTPVYNSCRNRHCPTCQGLDEVRWAEARRAAFLPVPYFHVVFTVPAQLHDLFRTNPRRAYGLLFTAAAETLQTVAAHPQHLGATIGAIAVLHTWTQRLAFHPHLHCLVPGGGLSPDGQRWIASGARFFLPVRALMPVFRATLLAAFERGLARGELRVPPDWPADGLRQAARPRWVVYCKPPFAGPASVVTYLARYAHRIALRNERLVALRDGHVTFRWRDRAHGDQVKQTTMDALTFARQFLQHVLPQGFVRIRYYGFLANAVRRARLAQCRALLGAAAPPPPTRESWVALLQRLTGRDVTQCPRCRVGTLVATDAIDALAPAASPRGGARAPPPPTAAEVAA